MQEKAKILIQKYNQGMLKPEEEQLLEQYIEQGWIELEELKDIQEMDQQLDLLFGNRLSYQLRRNFQAMMVQEKSRQNNPGLWQKINHFFASTPRLNLAYTLLLMFFALSIGWWMKGTGAASSQEVAMLSNELQQMRETMMLSMLEKESASERLKAVNLTQEMNDVNDQVVNALLQTLQQDKNANVRLAAIDALVVYAADSNVREGLIQSIRFQDSPLVQMALAEVMVALQEKRSVQPFRELLEKGNTPKEVQERIESSMEILL